MGLLYSLLYGKSTFSSSPSADFSTLQVIAADTKRLKKKKKVSFKTVVSDYTAMTGMPTH